MKIKFIGIREDRTETELPAPEKARYDAAEDAPADGFSGVFPLDEDCGTLIGLKILGDGDMLFYGTVDIQREIVSGSGSRLELTCRSLAGLLLDSAAVPVLYENLCLKDIFARHIQPYGFTDFRGETALYGGPFRVIPGMSEWQAAALFCRRFLRVTPRVNGTVFDASGGAVPDGPAFGAGGTKYFCAEVRNRCCDRVTQIDTPDAQTGIYRIAAWENALPLRVRCLTKAGADAEAVMAQARRSAFAVLVECPGAPAAEIGAKTSLSDPLLGTYENMKVADIRCELDSGGLRTRYCLRRDEPCGFQTR